MARNPHDNYNNYSEEDLAEIAENAERVAEESSHYWERAYRESADRVINYTRRQFEEFSRQAGNQNIRQNNSNSNDPRGASSSGSSNNSGSRSYNDYSSRYNFRFDSALRNLSQSTSIFGRTADRYLEYSKKTNLSRETLLTDISNTLVKFADEVIGILVTAQWNKGYKEGASTYEQYFTEFAGRMQTSYSETRKFFTDTYSKNASNNAINTNQELIPAISEALKKGWTGENAYEVGLTNAIDKKLMPWLNSASDKWNNILFYTKENGNVDVNSLKAQQLMLQKSTAGNRLLESGVVNTLMDDISPILTNIEYNTGGAEQLGPEAMAEMEALVNAGYTEQQAYAKVKKDLDIYYDPTKYLESGANPTEVLKAAEVARGGGLEQMASVDQYFLGQAGSTNDRIASGFMLHAFGSDTLNGVYSGEEARKQGKAIGSVDWGKYKDVDPEIYEEAADNLADLLTATEKNDNKRQNEAAVVGVIAQGVAHGSEILDKMWATLKEILAACVAYFAVKKAGEIFGNDGVGGFVRDIGKTFAENACCDDTPRTSSPSSSIPCSNSGGSGGNGLTKTITQAVIAFASTVIGKEILSGHNAKLATSSEKTITESAVKAVENSADEVTESAVKAVTNNADEVTESAVKAVTNNADEVTESTLKTVASSYDEVADVGIRSADSLSNTIAYVGVDAPPPAFAARASGEISDPLATFTGIYAGVKADKKSGLTKNMWSSMWNTDEAMESAELAVRNLESSPAGIPHTVDTKALYPRMSNEDAALEANAFIEEAMRNGDVDVSPNPRYTYDYADDLTSFYKSAEGVENAAEETTEAIMKSESIVTDASSKAVSETIGAVTNTFDEQVEGLENIGRIFTDLGDQAPEVMSKGSKVLAKIAKSKPIQWVGKTSVVQWLSKNGEAINAIGTAADALFLLKDIKDAEKHKEDRARERDKMRDKAEKGIEDYTEEDARKYDVMSAYQEGSDAMNTVFDAGQFVLDYAGPSTVLPQLGLTALQLGTNFAYSKFTNAAAAYNPDTAEASTYGHNFSSALKGPYNITTTGTALSETDEKRVEDIANASSKKVDYNPFDYRTSATAHARQSGKDAINMKDTYAKLGADYFDELYGDFNEFREFNPHDMNNNPNLFNKSGGILEAGDRFTVDPSLTANDVMFGGVRYSTKSAKDTPVLTARGGFPFTEGIVYEFSDELKKFTGGETPTSLTVSDIEEFISDSNLNIPEGFFTKGPAALKDKSSLSSKLLTYFWNNHNLATDFEELAYGKEFFDTLAASTLYANGADAFQTALEEQQVNALRDVESIFALYDSFKSGEFIGKDDDLIPIVSSLYENIHNLEEIDSVFKTNVLPRYLQASDRVSKFHDIEEATEIGDYESYASGTPYITHEQLALLHPGEAVINAQTNRALMPDLLQTIRQADSNISKSDSQVPDAVNAQNKLLQQLAEKIVVTILSLKENKAVPVDNTMIMMNAVTANIRNI